jgi:uncharacterized DUF497 family protein
MILHSFEWDEGNIEHVARHQLSPGEVEEVFDARYVVLRGRDGRYVVLGQTVTGRYLFVVVENWSGIGRVVTARDMGNSERRLYKRKK